MASNDSTIDVVLICFNQEKYISSAIESVMNQRCQGLANIYIGDDCSTDKTASIVKKFSVEYPNLIRPIIRHHNVGPSANLVDLINKCDSKYIAILEGDDFWTDECKLAKQIDFLDNNIEYVAISHRYSLVDEDGSLISSEYNGVGRPYSGDYVLDDFQNYRYFGLLGSVLMRNPKDLSHDLIIVESVDGFIGDITLNLYLLSQGKIWVSDYNMAAHRIIIEKKGKNYKSSIFKKNQALARIEYFDRLIAASDKYLNFSFVLQDRRVYYLALSVYFLIKHPSMHNIKALKYVFLKFKYSFSDCVGVAKELVMLILAAVRVRLEKRKFK